MEVNGESPTTTKTEEILTGAPKTKATFSSLLKPHLSNYCPASNLAFNEAIHKMRAQGRDICHFAFGQSPFPVVEGAKKVLMEHAGENAYLPVAGMLQFDFKWDSYIAL